MTLTLAGLSVGTAEPCVLVAEMSNAHNGDKDRLGRLIDAAQAAGADVVKFQAYTPDELVTLRGDGPAPAPWGDDGTTMRQLYEHAQTPLAWWPDIVRHCERVGMPWFSSVFGPESLAVLEANGCPAYKVAALDNGHADLIAAARATGKPVLVSARSYREAVRMPPDVRALYCPPGYPVPLAEVHLPWFANAPLDFLGLSSHCLAPELAVAAVARGAKLLEYHFQLAATPSVLERDVSLYEHEFSALRDAVRATEAMLA